MGPRRPRIRMQCTGRVVANRTSPLFEMYFAGSVCRLKVEGPRSISKTFFTQQRAG